MPLIVLSLAACKPSTDKNKQETQTYLESTIAANNKVIEQLSILRDSGKGNTANVNHELNRHMMIDGYLHHVMEGLKETPKDIWAKEEKMEKAHKKSSLESAGDHFVKTMDKKMEEANFAKPSFKE